MVALVVDEVVNEAAVPTERLETEACTLAAQLAAATCRFLLIVAELDRREAWRQWGCASMGQWLSWKCGLGVVAGRQHVRVARALEHLPVITAAFGEGRLSYSKVRALVRVATPGTEATLVEFALMATAAQVDQTVPVVERLLCDTSVRAVATDPAVGTATPPRRTRTIPRALRRLIAARDRGCRWPGCTHQRFLHVHHLVHFTRGGPTDAVNCFQLCTFHHRLVHEGGWRIAGDPAESSGLTFVSPRGRRITEHQPPARSEG